ncbi:MAG: TonB-dependent receptor plug domain-containing protein [Opitutaceae bacterium]
MRFTKFPGCTAAALLAISAFGSETPKPENENAAAGDLSVFHLGEFEVRVDRELPIDVRTDVVTAATIQSFERRDLSSALNVLPGVTLNSVAGRNEIGVHVRGFDLRQTPLFIDGIPVYVPYDGYVDLGRFTTFDVGMRRASLARVVSRRSRTATLTGWARRSQTPNCKPSTRFTTRSPGAASRSSGSRCGQACF